MRLNLLQILGPLQSQASLALQIFRLDRLVDLVARSIVPIFNYQPASATYRGLVAFALCFVEDSAVLKAKRELIYRIEPRNAVVEASINGAVDHGRSTNLREKLFARMLNIGKLGPLVLFVFYRVRRPLREIFGEVEASPRIEQIINGLAHLGDVRRHHPPRNWLSSR